MDFVVLLIGLVAIALIGFVVVAKREEDGYKKDAKDLDKDGIVQEGTAWERPEDTVKIIPAKKAPAKKTAAKKAPVKKAPAKKAPAKKAAPAKKTTAKK